jgi:hypothetical protein
MENDGEKLQDLLRVPSIGDGREDGAHQQTGFSSVAEVSTGIPDANRMLDEYVFNTVQR